MTMGGDDRTRLPAGQQPIVQRRPGDPRQEVPIAKAPPRRPYVREDDSTEPPQLPGRPPSAAPIESFSSGAPRDRMVENGKFGELFVLFIINLLYGIATLGIYRFWGKTRIRKYIWSRTSLRGDHFEYSGTGMELFLGFLFALFTFGPPFFGLYFWIYFNQPAQTPNDPEYAARVGLYLLAVLALMIVAFYFLHVATFSAYRYRLSRTLWRGIRGSVGGSAWTYGFMGFGLSFLNGLSLGWIKPWADTVLLKYRLNQTKIGTEPIACNIKAGPLYPSFTVAWVISFLTTIIVVVALIVVTLDYREFFNDPTKEKPFRLLLLLVLLYLIVPAVWLVTINFYRAALIRRLATASTLGGLKFRFHVGGWRLLWFNVSNFLLVLLTVGLLLPLVILRYARFVAEHLRVEGELDYAKIRQTDDRGPRYGEGIAEFFGMGVI